MHYRGKNRLQVCSQLGIQSRLREVYHLHEPEYAHRVEHLANLLIDSGQFNVSTKPIVVAAIPAFNEENSIAKIILQARKYVDLVIVCDDGSEDLTHEIAESLGAFVIKHERNMGYGASILSLFKEAQKMNADHVITIDGDGQHDAREIPILLDRMNGSDFDIVIGSRFIDGGGSETPGWRRWGIELINRFTQNGSVKISDSQSGFRAYNRKALDSLSLTEDGMGISTEILLKAGDLGLRVAEVPIHVTYNEKSSTRNPFTHGFDVVLSTIKHLSLHHPLTFYGLPGIASLIFSLFFWVLTFEEYTISKTILTNAALLGIGTMVVGLMLLTTAMILWVITTLILEQAKR